MKHYRVRNYSPLWWAIKSSVLWMPALVIVGIAIDSMLFGPMYR